MSRLVLLSSGLLVALVVCVLASASASADTCTGGSHLVFCNDDLEPLTGTPVSGPGELALLAGHIGGTEAKFDCTSGDFTATLGALGTGTGLILLLSCKEEKPAKCKLAESQELELDFSFSIQQESPTLATFTGNVGPRQAFTLLTVENKGAETCAVSGSLLVTGKQMVLMLIGDLPRVKQEILALKLGSTMSMGTETGATFSTAVNAKLASGLAWLVLAGE